MKEKSFKEKCREANERADIVAVALHLGMDVRTQGRVPFAHCPFHGDTGRMNLAFYQEPGEKIQAPRCYCYSCRTQATALDLIMHQRQCSLPEALDWLRSYLGLSNGMAAPLPPRVVQRPARPRTDKRKAIDHAIGRLWDEKIGREARDYLEYRGVLSIAEQYQLGYWNVDDSGWSGRVVIPYLESESRESSVWTMVGGRIRPPDHMVGGVQSAQGETSGASGGAPVRAGQIQPGRYSDSPKYLYTSRESREPYLWRIALNRAEQAGYLILCEGELDGLSLLYSLGGDSPVAALGGVGAISTVGREPRLAGLDILYVADRESLPRIGTEFEEADLKKQDRITKVVAENVWKLKQLNANVRVAYPPDINNRGKTDVNDLLMSHGGEGVLDWLLPELELLTSSEPERSLI